jgi:tetratricopeptide (TPR) repeat protein
MTTFRQPSRMQNCSHFIPAMQPPGTQTFPKYSSYLRRTVLFLGIVALICLVVSGCTRDPIARRQKFMEQGDRYFAQEKFSEALLTYGRALQFDPKFAPAHYKIAKCQLKLANWTSAFQELQLTTDLAPEYMPAHRDLGQLYLTGGRGPDARDEARVILKSNPQDVDAQMLLSAADALIGNLQDALREADEAVKTSPGNSAVYLNLANIQLKASAFQDAITNFQKAEAVAPASPASAIALGSLYESQKRWDDAEKAFRRAITIAPKNAAPRAALAAMYIAQGQGAFAERVLQDAKAELREDPVASRMLGDYYLSLGDSAKALTEFASLSNDHPKDLKIRESYIQLLILTHQIDQAAKLTGEILKKSPQDAEGLILNGQILLQNGKFSDALYTLQQAVKGDPANPVGHYQLGMAYLSVGNMNQAEGQWREAVELRPTLTEAWVALGSSAAQRQDWTNLEPIGIQLKKISPQSPGGYLFHATARFNQGDPVSAEADLNQLIQLAPEIPMGYAKLGQLRASQKRWNEAERYYQEALKRAPDDPDAIQGMVDLDFRRGRAADARQFVQAQIDRAPNNAGLYLLLGQSYLQENRLVDARQSFLNCLEIEKQNLTGLIMLGHVEQALGHSAEAIANYQHAIAIAPNNAELYTTLAVSFEGQGNWQEAQTAYQRALALDPEGALAANNLACLMLEHGGNVNVALTLAQTARRGLPNLPNSADTLGWAYLQNGAYSLAAPLLEKAVKSAPSNATYRYHLGLTYQKLNDLGRARTEFEKSIRLDPKAPSAEKASRALSGLSGD